MLLDAATGHLDCIAFCGWDHLSGIEESRQMLSRFFKKHEVLPLECRVLEAVLVRLAA
jgi:hypothetical protein